MSKRILHRYSLGVSAVAEKYLDGVCDRTLVRIEVVEAVTFVLVDVHARRKSIDPGICGNFVLIVIGRKLTENKANGSHVLQDMIAIGGIIQRAGFIDDAKRGLVGGDHNALDCVEARCYLGVKFDRSFDGGLGVEFRREGDLEEYVLHNVTAEGTRQNYGL